MADKNNETNFIDFLVEKGYLENRHAETLRMLQESRFFFGVLALREEFITIDELETALTIQASGGNNMKLGQIMIENDFMNLDQVRKVLAMQNSTAECQAELVIDVGLLPESLLQKSLDEFNKFRDQNKKDAENI